MNKGEIINTLTESTAMNSARLKMGPGFELSSFWTNSMGLVEKLFVDAKDKSTGKSIRMNASELLPNNWFDLMDKLYAQ